MRLVRLFAICLFMGFIALACTKKPASTQFSQWISDNGKVKVISTTGIVYDLVENIGKERIDQITLIPLLVDPHSYELRKGDQEKLASADLVFCNGLHLEHTVSIKNWLDTSDKVVSVGDKIKEAYPERLLTCGNVIDPHIWMDLSIWELGIDHVVKALSGIDPEHREFYEKNGREFRLKLKQVDQEIYAVMQDIHEKQRHLVTCHDAFGYFGRRYLAEIGEGEAWQERVMAPDGLAPQSQISLIEIQSIVEHLKKHAIKVVFPERNLNQNSLKKIIDACSQYEIYVNFANEQLYGDTLGEKGSDAETLLDMMKKNAQIISKQLGGSDSE